ncbi:uncharacterized protein LOC108477847 [Gossypium arboreum]|uniref:uncharacterized protein LOC108477847 n=1 Tax=Gossypium arboreum TaxID=29729 RepID=UPI000819340E|nr:uncharacterized protein LOC108477847 [Gossypium arboreum]
MGHVAHRCFYRYDSTYDDEPYPSRTHFVPSTVYQPTFQPFVVSSEGTPTALQASVASTIATTSIVTDPLWYPDSGATTHMTNDPVKFTNYNFYIGQGKVIVGNGNYTSISHIGESSISSGSHNFSINNLLYDLMTHRVLLQGIESNGLYQLLPTSSNEGYKYVDKTGRVYISRHVQFDEGVFPYVRLSSVPSVTNSNGSKSLSTLPIIIILPHIASHHSLDNTTIGFAVSPSIAAHIESSQPPSSINSNIFGDNDLFPNPSIPDDQNTSSSDFAPYLSPSNTHHMFTRSKADVNDCLRLKNPDESVAHNKVRLIPQAFSQIVGMDYHETFSPVVKANKVRTLFALVVSSKWKIRQVDVNNVFLNGLTEEVFMQQPPGFEVVDENDLEPLSYFLRIEVAKHGDSMHISQQKYARELLDKADMGNAKSISTPMEDCWRSPVSLHDRARNYVMYLPSDVHWTVVTRILRLQVNYVSRHDQVADILTKPLTTRSFSKFRDRLNVVALKELQHRNAGGILGKMNNKYNDQHNSSNYP